MALIAVSITKSVPFQGVGERFSNVYHYDVPFADIPHAEAVIDRLEAVEAACHAGIVSFVEGRAWTAGGLPAENETVLIKDLTRVGEHFTDGRMYRENAWIVTWKTERPSATGKPVHLRKFLHTQSQFASVLVDDITNGQAELPPFETQTLLDYEAGVRQLATPLGTFQLTAPSGRVAANPGTVVPYLQSREFHN